MLKKLYDRCLDLARHKLSKPFLAFVSFIESSFFPIPPDVMIVPMVLAKKDQYFRIFLIATIFSVLGGIFGAFSYVVAFNTFPVFQQNLNQSMAIGASASVLAIVTAIATYTPNYSVQLTLIGRVKLKHIAIFSILLDILSIPKGNAGGHIAHRGGALYGFLYILQLKSG